MDEKKFKEGINCFAQSLGSFLELRKMGYTQEEINWAYNTMSGNFVPNFNVKNLSNLIESRKENWKINKKSTPKSARKEEISNYYILCLLYHNILKNTICGEREIKWNIQ